MIVPNPNCSFQEIRLKTGESVFVDTLDYEKVMNFEWYFMSGYAKMTREPKLLMHHYILDWSPVSDKEVHHKDENGLNNCRRNLIILTLEDHAKTKKAHKDNLTGYKGVSFSKCHNKFKSRLMYNRTEFWLGLHLTAEDAARAYDKKVKELNLSHSYLNFP